MSALPPLDANGRTLQIGAAVLIPALPQWLVHDLPAADVERLRIVEGQIMPISDIDKHGYIWFSSPEGSPWFCLRPNEVRLATF